MSKIILTDVGKQHIAQMRASKQNFVLDQVKFANVANLKDKPSATDTAPSMIAHTSSFIVPSFLNPDTVVYNVELTSAIGDFTFNWVGYYSNNALCFIEHMPLQSKTKTRGSITGNTFFRNLRLITSRGADLSGASAPTESWKIDYTSQFQDLSQGEERINQHIFGKVAFLGNSFKVSEESGSANDFKIQGGSAYVDGFSLAFLDTTYKKHRKDWLKLSDAPPTLSPAASGTKTEYVFLKIFFNRTAGIATPTAEIVVNNASAITDSQTAQGTKIKFIQIAKLVRDTKNQITSSQITDTRSPIHTVQSGSNKSEILKQIQDVDTAVKAEETARQAADSAIIGGASAPYANLKKTENAIIAEVAARKAADSAIIGGASAPYANLKKTENAIIAEVAARKAADSALVGGASGAYDTFKKVQSELEIEAWQNGSKVTQSIKKWVQWFLDSDPKSYGSHGFNTVGQIARAVYDLTTGKFANVNLTSGRIVTWDNVKKTLVDSQRLITDHNGNWKDISEVPSKRAIYDLLGGVKVSFSQWSTSFHLSNSTFTVVIPNSEIHSIYLLYIKIDDTEKIALYEDTKLLIDQDKQIFLAYKGTKKTLHYKMPFGYSSMRYHFISKIWFV